MRLFLDANILFSAAHRETGSVRIFFRLAESGACELVSSPYAIDEARRNISRKYPERSADLEKLVTHLSVCAKASPESTAWATQQQLRSQDAPILAAAVQAQAAVLVTGDRTDFGHLFGKSMRGVQVLPPAAAIKRIISEN